MAFSTRAALKAVLGLQVGLVFGLLAVDFREIVPDLGLSRSVAPAFDLPVLPGDQTRRFAPSGPRLLPGRRAPGLDTSDQPSRLLFEEPRAGELRLTGMIAPGDAARFADWLKERRAVPAPLPETVQLDSAGGSVSDALQIGRMIRDLELNTRMEAEDLCLSACPYVLAGGVTRVISAQARVGVHQHYFGESYLPAFLAVHDIQRSQADVLRHLGEMDVDPSLMVAAMSTPPEDIYVLLPEQLTAWRVATDLTE